MNRKPSKAFLQEALTNNSFDVDSTDKAIRITLDHSFSYLYRLQRNMVCYEEYFYTTRNVVGEPDYGDVYMDARERPCINFPASMVLPQYREKFRTSNYYKSQIDYNDLKKDHKLFSRLPVILIDNHLLRTCTLDVYDDFFTAHLPFDRYFLHTKEFNNDEWQYHFIDHEISLQVINNSYYQDARTNSAMLRANSYGDTYDRIRASYLKDLGINISPDDKGIYFASIFIADNQLGSQLLRTQFDKFGDLVIYYDEDTIQALNGCMETVTIRFLFIAI